LLSATVQSTTTTTQFIIVGGAQQKMNTIISQCNVNVDATSDCIIGQPTHTDVLLGRGVSTNRRAGNAYFREIVSHHMVSSWLANTELIRASSTHL
jgi:hypothetical protein